MSNEFGNTFLRETMSHTSFVKMVIKWPSLVSNDLGKGLWGTYGLIKGQSSAPYSLGKGLTADGLGKYGWV